MAFIPCLGVADPAASMSFYRSLGFDIDSSPAYPGHDLHLLLFRGQFCAMLYRSSELREYQPVLAGTAPGLHGMLYLAVDDIDAMYEHVARHTPIVKPMATDGSGQRLFYFRDPDGYVIGVNDSAALAASSMAKYARTP
ncbi:VOC family protein [Nocardia sp. NPDC052566]|uniref:VOC family protein n=1 Tax=Nocardia sp. NPDC052566 TaxID=3364330 RepID=UPI0037C7A9FD